jgi:hypothetical protein
MWRKVSQMSTIPTTLFAILLVYMCINALYMLIAPRAWFRLPSWFRAQGSLPTEHYSTGWGILQLRLAGAVILGGAVWVIYSVFLSRG